MVGGSHTSAGSSVELLKSKAARLSRILAAQSEDLMNELRDDNATVSTLDSSLQMLRRIHESIKIQQLEYQGSPHLPHRVVAEARSNRSSSTRGNSETQSRLGMRLNQRRPSTAREPDFPISQQRLDHKHRSSQSHLYQQSQKSQEPRSQRDIMVYKRHGSMHQAANSLTSSSRLSPQSGALVSRFKSFSERAKPNAAKFAISSENTELNLPEVQLSSRLVRRLAVGSGIRPPQRTLLPRVESVDDYCEEIEEDANSQQQNVQTKEFSHNRQTSVSRIVYEDIPRPPNTINDEESFELNIPESLKKENPLLFKKPAKPAIPKAAMKKSFDHQTILDRLIKSRGSMARLHQDQQHKREVRKSTAVVSKPDKNNNSLVVDSSKKPSKVQNAKPDIKVKGVISTQVTSSQGSLAYPIPAASKGDIGSQVTSKGDLPVDRPKRQDGGIKGLLERMMTFDPESRDPTTQDKTGSKGDLSRLVESGKAMREKTKQFTLGAFGPVAEENSSAVGETSGPGLSSRHPHIVHHHTNQIRINIGEMPAKRSIGLTFGELAERK